MVRPKLDKQLDRLVVRTSTPCSLARAVSRFSFVMRAHPSWNAVWAIKASRECLMFPDLRGSNAVSSSAIKRQKSSREKSKTMACSDRPTEEHQKIEQPLTFSQVRSCSYLIDGDMSVEDRQPCGLDCLVEDLIRANLGEQWVQRV